MDTQQRNDQSRFSNRFRRRLCSYIRRALDSMDPTGLAQFTRRGIGNHSLQSRSPAGDYLRRYIIRGSRCEIVSRPIIFLFGGFGFGFLFFRQLHQAVRRKWSGNPSTNRFEHRDQGIS